MNYYETIMKMPIILISTKFYCCHTFDKLWWKRTT